MCLSIPLHYRQRQVSIVWPSFTMAHCLNLSFDALPWLLALPTHIPHCCPTHLCQDTPILWIFCGSPLSTRLSLMTILSFCDLATTTFLSFFIYFSPPNVQPKLMSGLPKHAWHFLTRAASFVWNSLVCHLNLLKSHLVFKVQHKCTP